MSANPIEEAVRAQAAAWFAEYDKHNHFPEMVALDAYAAGHAAAQQHGGWDLKEVVCLACGDHIMPMGQVCHACSHPVPAPPSAPVGDRREIERVIGELRAYNPAADEHRGAHIHGVWAKELERALAQQPAAVDEAMVFRLAVWMAKRDGHDDPHHLIWEGSPPEPWGEVWNRYEDDARAALTAALATQHQEPTT
jgi:hypothetical protein